MNFKKNAARLCAVAVMTSGMGAVATTPAEAASHTAWNKIARCESGGNWKINTGNSYYGGLQFSYRTWKAFGGQKYAKTANRASKAQQITIANKVLRAQGWKAWPHCSKKVGLR